MKHDDENDNVAFEADIHDNAESADQEARELPDEKLEEVSGGTTPTIRPF